MINNNILISNNEVIIQIKEQEACWAVDRCSEAIQVIKDYIAEEDITSIEDLREKTAEACWEAADSDVPVYNYQIQDVFSGIPAYKVDEYAQDFCIEYDGENFNRFQAAVIFAHYYTELIEELDLLIDALEEELIEDEEGGDLYTDLSPEEIKREAQDLFLDEYNPELEDALIDLGYYNGVAAFWTAFEGGRLLSDDLREYAQEHLTFITSL